MNIRARLVPSLAHMRSAKLHLALPGAVLSMTEAAENMEQMPRVSQHYNVQHSPKKHKHAYHIISLSASRAISTESFLAPFLHLSPRPTPLLVVQLFSHVEHHALHEQRGLCCEPRVPETSPTGNSENISNKRAEEPMYPAPCATALARSQVPQLKNELLSVNSLTNE